MTADPTPLPVEALPKKLRKLTPATPTIVFWVKEAADAIEALTAERDRLRAAIERHETEFRNRGFHDEADYAMWAVLDER